MSDEDDDEEAEDDAVADSDQTDDTVPKFQHIKGKQVDLYLQNPDEKTISKKGKFLKIATLTVADPQPKIPKSFDAANDQQTQPGDYIMIKPKPGKFYAGHDFLYLEFNHSAYALTEDWEMFDTKCQRTHVHTQAHSHKHTHTHTHTHTHLHHDRDEDSQNNEDGDYTAQDCVQLAADEADQKFDHVQFLIWHEFLVPKGKPYHGNK